MIFDDEMNKFISISEDSFIKIWDLENIISSTVIKNPQKM